MGRKVDIAKYQMLCEEILNRSGFCPDDSKAVAAIMVDNEKMGISTHGSFHMLTYLKKIRAGSIDPKGEIKVIEEGPTWANIDANYNLGFVASYRAMELAIKKAKEYGMAYVTVKNSSHYGTGAAYELMAAKEGMASIVCSNTWKLMAVPGSKSVVIGNSPLGYGFPAGKNPPVFMDIATSAASLTKTIRAKEMGEKVPDGWIVDENGLPTNDPNSPNFSLVPVGAHKGYEATNDYTVWEADCTMKYCLKEPEALYDYITGTLKPVPVSPEGNSSPRNEVDIEMKHKLPPLSEMERIEQSLLSEKLDEILDRIDNEDIGFVITENGLPKVVIVPFRWFSENFPDEVPDGL